MGATDRGPGRVITVLAATVLLFCASVFAAPTAIASSSSGANADRSGGREDSRPLLVARGVNVSGPEFGSTTLPGTYGVDYFYDGIDTLEFLASRGIKIVRLPFRWERIQPNRRAPLDPAELDRLTTFVNSAAAVGIKTVLDLHNFARYVQKPEDGGATLLLGSTLPVDDLTDLWTRLSAVFKNNPGVYGYGLMNEPHDLPGRPGTFSGTVRYDWSSGDLQGWTGGAASASNVAGKLRLSDTATDGYFNLRKDDGGADRNPASGNELRAKVTLGNDVAGTWTARLEWQNSSYSWRTPSSVTYQRTDTGEEVHSLIPGVEVLVTADFTEDPIAPGRPFAIQVESNAATAGAVTVDVDDFAQGSMSGATSPAQVWESASATVLSAIRAAGDDTLVFVPGYQWASAKDWAKNHPHGWITDPNIKYEAHYYFDSDNTGTYSNSFAAENAAAVSAGYRDLAQRAVAELSGWLKWLRANHVRGYLGEIGWPNTGDAAEWNAVGDALYDLLDRGGVDASYWATGQQWGTGYALSSYTGHPISDVRPQAAVVEAHHSSYVPVGFRGALPAVVVPRIPTRKRIPWRRDYSGNGTFGA